ncbi:protein containing FecR protein domain protein, partial [human gut metagenome]
MQMTLADGTLVHLNAGTTLEYPVVFSRKDRRVKLTGEALFEVAHNAKHPFIVETFATDLQVLGTNSM